MSWWQKLLAGIAVLAILLWVGNNPHHAGVTIRGWGDDVVSFAQGLSK